MINPFKSNTDQLLFRKNYQILHKPAPPPPAPSHNHSQSRLQARNPFSDRSPRLPFPSPQRSASLSRSNVGSSAQVFFPKGGILETTDGWKREFESKERQKLQVYGAEGLRYNAYTLEQNAYMLEYPRRQNTHFERNEYYEVVKPDVKSPSGRFDKYDSAKNYYISPKENRAHSPRDKVPQNNRREMFEDEISESPNFNLIDPRKDSHRSVGSNSSRHSKVHDMFQSQMDDRMKRSMQYASYYGGVQEQMIESKKRGGSRFKDSIVQNQGAEALASGKFSSVESSVVHRLEMSTPCSIRLWGALYQRIPL